MSCVYNLLFLLNGQTGIHGIDICIKIYICKSLLLPQNHGFNIYSITYVIIVRYRYSKQKRAKLYKFQYDKRNKRITFGYGIQLNEKS